jgi:hypothetical protein
MSKSSVARLVGSFVTITRDSRIFGSCSISSRAAFTNVSLHFTETIALDFKAFNCSNVSFCSSVLF